MAHRETFLRFHEARRNAVSYVERLVKPLLMWLVCEWSHGQVARHIEIATRKRRQKEMKEKRERMRTLKVRTAALLSGGVALTGEPTQAQDLTMYLNVINEHKNTRTIVLYL